MANMSPYIPIRFVPAIAVPMQRRESVQRTQIYAPSNHRTTG